MGWSSGGTAVGEELAVLLWRSDELERLGFSPGRAGALAADPEVDLHEAQALVAAGCSLELAEQILAGQSWAR